MDDLNIIRLGMNDLYKDYQFRLWMDDLYNILVRDL